MIADRFRITREGTSSIWFIQTRDDQRIVTTTKNLSGKACHEFINHRWKHSFRKIDHSLNNVSDSNNLYIHYIKDIKKILESFKSSGDINNYAANYSRRLSNELINSDFSSNKELREDNEFIEISFNTRDPNLIEEWIYISGSNQSPLVIESLRKKIERTILKKETTKERLHQVLSLPVIFHSEASSILIHEVLGHVLESDVVIPNIVKTDIVFNHNINLIDTARSSTSFININSDNEGNEAKDVTLIHNGKLQTCLNSLTQTALPNNSYLHGNGRAATIGDIPLPRMRNLVLKKGNYAVDKAIRSLAKGLFVEKTSPRVFLYPEQDLFWIDVTHLRYIYKGKLSSNLEPLSLYSKLSTIFNQITPLDGKSTDLEGFCHKKGQFIPVNTRSAGIYIAEMNIANVNN